MSIQALVPAQLRHCGVQQMGVIYPAQDKAALPTCCLQGSAKLLANTARCHGFLCKQDGFIVGKLAAETIRQGINLTSGAISSLTGSITDSSCGHFSEFALRIPRNCEQFHSFLLTPHFPAQKRKNFLLA